MLSFSGASSGITTQSPDSRRKSQRVAAAFTKMAMLIAASLLSSASLGGLLFAARTGADAVEAGAGPGSEGLTVDVGGLNCAVLPGATSYK